MKKTLILLIAAVLALTPAFCAGESEVKKDANAVSIGVSKIVAHPALDSVEKGMQDYLATTSYYFTFDFQNANGEVSTAVSIAQKFKSDKCSVVVGIGTPVAQALVQVFDDTPIVFSAITDPVSAGLVDSIEGKAGTNVCGTSDLNPVFEQIQLLVQTTGAKTVGNIYTSGEANGVTLNDMAKEACAKLGVELVSASVANSSEVKMATQSIIDRVDAVYISTDNTVISALSSVADVCTKGGKPLMSGDPTSVEGLDFLLAWGFNYYKLGVATGKIIENILNGTDPGSIGTVYLTEPADFELWVNKDNAKALGITLGADLLDMASVVIENGAETKK